MKTEHEVSKCIYCGGNIAADAIWCHLCGRKVDDPESKAHPSKPLTKLPSPVAKSTGEADPHPEEEMLVSLLTRPSTEQPIFALNAEAPQHRHRRWWVDVCSFRRRTTKPWYIKARDVILLILFSVLLARMVFEYLSR